MEQLGKVQEWNDDKGYGFIVELNPSISSRLFFHISDYRQNGRRPEVGELANSSASYPGKAQMAAHVLYPSNAPCNPLARTPENRSGNSIRGKFQRRSHCCLLPYSPSQWLGPSMSADYLSGPA